MNRGNTPQPAIKIDRWTNHQAIQIVAMLPEDTEKALAILDRARWLLICWNCEAPTPIRAIAPVLVKT